MSNAERVCDLTGPFTEVSVAGSEGVGFSGTGAVGTSSTGREIRVGEGTVGLRFGSPVRVTAGVSETSDFLEKSQSDVRRKLCLPGDELDRGSGERNPAVLDEAAAEAEVGFFDGATVGLTKYAREAVGIGNGGLALCGPAYNDAGTAGAVVGGLVAVYTPDGALEVASHFPDASAWLVEHGDEVTQIKDALEEVLRHVVGK